MEISAIIWRMRGVDSALLGSLQWKSRLFTKGERKNGVWSAFGELLHRVGME
jgi:hypothetical protein